MCHTERTSQAAKQTWDAAHTQTPKLSMHTETKRKDGRQETMVAHAHVQNHKASHQKD